MRSNINAVSSGPSNREPSLTVTQTAESPHEPSYCIALLVVVINIQTALHAERSPGHVRQCAFLKAT